MQPHLWLICFCLTMRIVGFEELRANILLLLRLSTIDKGRGFLIVISNIYFLEMFSLKLKRQNAK